MLVGQEREGDGAGALGRRAGRGGAIVEWGWGGEGAVVGEEVRRRELEGLRVAEAGDSCDRRDGVRLGRRC